MYAIRILLKKRTTINIMQEIKTHLIKVYYSPEEKAFVDKHAQLNQLCPSSYVKLASINYSMNSTSSLNFFSLYNYGSILQKCFINLQKIAAKTDDISIVQEIERITSIMRETMLTTEDLSFLSKGDAETMLSNQIEESKINSMPQLAYLDNW